MTSTDDLPTLKAARAYLRREGDEMIANFAPFDDDDVCVHGWAVRRLSRSRQVGTGRRVARPAANLNDYQLAAYEVTCRADDDREHAAELAAAIVVVARRDSLVCYKRGVEWTLAIKRGDESGDEAIKQRDRWRARQASLRTLADELARDYLTAA